MSASKQDKEFVSYVVDLMQSVGPVHAKSMFGGHGIYLDRLMFGLVADGVLYLKADEETENKFKDNGLERIVENVGWQKSSMAGKEGADAAWLILQHSISRPDFIRKCFPIFQSAVNEDEASARHLSCLIDGICYFSRKPQVYGNYFDWNENGEFCPWIIEDPDNVDERRAQVGLNTLEERIKEMEEGIQKNKLSPPQNYVKRQSEMNDF